MYPQPNSIEPVLNGQQAFRLTTPLAGGGDIYECEPSALAVAVGPNSDISNVEVTYFDDDSDSKVSSMIISPDRWFTGRIDARNEVLYPVSRKRGRILVAPSDIYDPTWTPLAFTEGDTIQYVTPVLDVIEYFVNPQAFTPQRSDRNFQFQFLEAPTLGPPVGSAWIVIPAYGRKSGWFSFRNQDPAETIDVTVQGIQLSTSASPGVRGTYEKTIMMTVNVLANSSTDFVFKSSEKGLWDLMAIELGNYRGNAMPITITLSDDPL